MTARLPMRTAAFAITALALLTAFSALSQDIKERMAQRLPAILELKLKGLVGEDSKGYVQFVGAAQEKADVVAAENADRKAVYERIAKTQGASAELVAKQRAAKNIANAKPGEWVQDSSGKWIKKQ